MALQFILEIKHYSYTYVFTYFVTFAGLHTAARVEQDEAYPAGTGAAKG